MVIRTLAGHLVALGQAARVPKKRINNNKHNGSATGREQQTHLLAVRAGEVVSGCLQVVLQGLLRRIFVDTFDTPKWEVGGEVRRPRVHRTSLLLPQSKPRGKFSHLIYSQICQLFQLAPAPILTQAAISSCWDRCHHLLSGLRPALRKAARSL